MDPLKNLMLVYSKHKSDLSMKIKLICIGKTKARYLKQGMDEYLNRLKHYTKFELVEWPGIKNKMKAEALKEAEGKWILDQLSPQDYLVLLDENGQNLRSVSFAKKINQWQVQAIPHLVFVIGGAYGFSPSVYEKANYQLSLSTMTFSHQMIRLFILEQIYRAFTILKGESYHNE
jgi:23S rRNA (pseudouridine1915-N3)-methyltransferase